MAKLDLWLDEDDVNDALSAGSFVLEIPSDAVQRGNFKDPNDDKARASWVQTMEIAESKMYEGSVKDGDGNEYPGIITELTFQIPPGALRPKTGEVDPNAGRQVKAWYKIVLAAMKNKQHPKYKSNTFSNGKLTSIVRAIWGSDAVPKGQGVNLGDFFSTDAVVGKTLTANLRNSKWEGNPRTEIADFVPAEMVNA